MLRGRVVKNVILVLEARDGWGYIDSNKKVWKWV